MKEKRWIYYLDLKLQTLYFLHEPLLQQTSLLKQHITNLHSYSTRKILDWPAVNEETKSILLIFSSHPNMCSLVSALFSLLSWKLFLIKQVSAGDSNSKLNNISFFFILSSTIQKFNLLDENIARNNISMWLCFHAWLAFHPMMKLPGNISSWM